jgi:two-component system response regulator
MDEVNLYPGDRYMLLVEDSADDAELTLRAFSKHRLANRVVHVSDGVEALDFLFARGAFAQRDPEHVPSLVLLDISMPRLGGHEVLEAMRADSRTARIPVVMLTSSDEQVDVAKAYDGGANSYVRKPVEFGEFIEAVGQLGVYWMLLNLPAEQPGGIDGGTAAG